MPLDFNFTEEQELFRRTLREFAEEEIKPKSAYWDENEEFPWEDVKKMAKMGLLSLYIPTEYGGQGADHVAVGIATEEIARIDCLHGTLLNVAAEEAHVISHYGTDEQKEKWFPPIVRGEKVFVIAVTEPECGSDVSQIKSKAERVGSNYVLNGEKQFITFVVPEGLSLTYVKTDPGKRARGVSAFVLPLDTPGVKRYRLKGMGLRGSSWGGFTMSDVRIPKDMLVGEENKGFYYLMSGLDFERALIALRCLGTAQSAIEDAVEYAKNRIVFGKSLAKYEEIQFRTVEMYTYMEAARLLAYKALWMMDQGVRATKWASMAKWFGSEIAFKAINWSIQVHGALGYSREHPEEKRLRDVRALTLGGGTTEVTKIVISRELFGKEYLPYK